MLITRRLEFDAGHRISTHTSQCRHLHGHRYAIEVTLSGNIIAEEGAPEGEKGGAPLMLEEGVFDIVKPEAAFGRHVWSALNAGQPPRC